MILVIAKAVILFLASALNIILGLMVYTKNPRDKVNINLALLALCSGIFTFAYGADYAYILFKYSSLEQVPYHYPYVFFSRLTYIGALGAASGVVFFLYLKSAKNIKIKRIIIYTIGGAVSLIAISTPAMIKSMNFKNGLLETVPGPLSVIGRIYFLIICIIISCVAYSYYRMSAGLQKIQAKYLMTGSLIFALSSTVVAGLLPLLGLARYTEFSPVSSLFWVGFSAYAIIRYRFLDIETVIHKTLLWLVTSGLILIPMALVLLFTYTWLASFTYAVFCIVIMALFFIFLYLYQYIQPRINHLFRRKQYDYQQILLEVGEKLTREIDIKKATATLVKEVTRLMYLRQGVVFVRNEDSGEYQRYASVGPDMPETAELAHSSAENMKIKEQYPGVIEFLIKKPEILERQQIGFNPEYQGIKEQGEKLFAALNVELLIPLTIEGKILGLLGIGKKETLKVFNPQDLEVLQKVGSEAGIALYNALHHEAIVEKERLAEEMRLGREIQRNLLPQAIPNVVGLKVAGFMRPAKEIGGDYYDYIVNSGKNSDAEVSGKVVKEEQKNGATVPLYPTQQTLAGRHSTTDRLSVVIGDVSGKGAAAGLIMATVKAILDTLSGEKEVSPKKVLARANSILCKYTQGSKFMTLLLFNWDSGQKSFEYASAGHEHIIVCRSAGNLERQASDKLQAEPLSGPSASGGFVECIKSGGMPLGLMPEVESHLADKQLKLEYGDKVVLFTDGVTEAKNEQEEFYGLERFVEMVKKHDRQDAAGLLKKLDEELNGFMGQRYQNDDITLVVMEAVRE